MIEAARLASYQVARCSDLSIPVQYSALHGFIEQATYEVGALCEGRGSRLHIPMDVKAADMAVKGVRALQRSGVGQREPSPGRLEVSCHASCDVLGNVNLGPPQGRCPRPAPEPTNKKSLHPLMAQRKAHAVETFGESVQS